MLRRRMRHAERMEGRDFRLFGEPFAQQGRGPLLHFVGRLVGERDGEDSVRGDAMADQLGDAVGDDPGFSGPRRQHQERPGKGVYGFGLGGIQVHHLDGTRPAAGAKGGRGERREEKGVRS